MTEHERKIRRIIETERHRQLGAFLHRGVRAMPEMLKITLLAAMAYLFLLVLCV
ncbi:hypothetical protein [Selenomonas montiformis]|uniref:hypothetical protein n=1 Tax=Selenomonas montiformis TaxID=2652285 RepID=UPI0012B5F010|nr:hypothetical protein [Selenomonas montiformis]